MKHLLLFTLIFLLSWLPAQQNVTGNLTFEGVDRVYTVHTPPAYDDGNPSLPLVINMHGFGSNRTQQQFYAGMDAVSNDNDFIVCYPDGVDMAWNVGWNFGSTANDVGFIDTLISRLIEDYGVDADRVYATGMSNGGFMSYVLACELSERITAIASVTGGMVPGSLEDCNPERQVPVMEIHGTADGTVPYNGSEIVVPTEETVAFWAERNDCNEQPTITPVPNTSTNDGSTAENWLYTDCADNTSVEFYRVIDGGHTWPGAVFPIGVTNQDFNASVEIWRFFSQFTLSGEPNAAVNLLAAEAVSIYPNPFDANIRVSAEDLLTVSVLSLNGQLLQQHLSQTDQVTIDTTKLAPGVYLLRVETKAGVYVERVVKG